MNSVREILALRGGYERGRIPLPSPMPPKSGAPPHNTHPMMLLHSSPLRSPPSPFTSPSTSPTPSPLAPAPPFLRHLLLLCTPLPTHDSATRNPVVRVFRYTGSSWLLSSSPLPFSTSSPLPFHLPRAPLPFLYSPPPTRPCLVYRIPSSSLLSLTLPLSLSFPPSLLPFASALSNFVCSLAPTPTDTDTRPIHHEEPARAL